MSGDQSFIGGFTRSRSCLQSLVGAVVLATTFSHLIVAPAAAAFQDDEASALHEEWLLRFDFQEVGPAIGFWMGQSLTLERIPDRFPDLARDCQRAAIEADLRFGRAVDEINRIAEERLGKAQWEEVTREMRAMIEEQLAIDWISKEQAVEFLAEVARRLEGEIESPIGEVFLAFHPDYRRRPVSEPLNGFVKEYVSTDEPKAAGLKVAMQYPQSWMEKQGRRPHILRSFSSHGGHGGAMAILYLRQLPDDERAAFEAEGVAALVTPEALAAEMPTARFVASGMVEMAGREASWVDYMVVRQSPGVFVRVKTRMYYFLYDGRLVSPQFSTALGALDGDELPGADSLDDLFLHFEQLFNWMAMSVDVYDRYE